MDAEKKTVYFITPFRCVYRKIKDGDKTRYQSWHWQLGKWHDRDDIDYYFSGMEDGHFVDEATATEYIKEHS